MAVQFPEIEPTEFSDFRMPEIPGTESVSTTGIRSYRQTGDLAVDALVSLTFANKTIAQCAAIMQCYRAASWIEPLALPPILFNGLGPDLEAAMGSADEVSGLRWFFVKGSGPSWSRVQRSGGRLVTIQVPLRAELRLSE